MIYGLEPAQRLFTLAWARSGRSSRLPFAEGHGLYARAQKKSRPAFSPALREGQAGCRGPEKPGRAGALP